MRPSVCLIALTLMLAPIQSGANPPVAAEPLKLTPCELLSDPGRYNHALVEISGNISQGFEDFTLEEGKCPTRQNARLWLEYGGKRQSQTVYCCGVDTGADRDTALVVEGIQTQLVDDPLFRRFDSLLHRHKRNQAGTVHATVIGRFFSGKETRFPAGVSWAGYGHMGFFSLLVVEQVLSVEPTTSP